MKALILNSGLGSRMAGLTDKRPKCMVELGGGYTILSRQLDRLAALGVREIIITTGPFAPLLQSHVEALSLPLSVAYVYNPDYRHTNYIVSMHRAAPLLAGHDVLLMHGDLVLETSVYKDLLACSDSVMATDATLPLPEKDFKAKLRDGRIVAVGVSLSGADCVACQPAYRLRAADFSQWQQSIAAFVARGETGVYAENAFNALDGALPLRPLPLNGRLCCEIDNPEDLAAVGARFRQSLAGGEQA